jgi:hypothetical protein
LWPEDGANSQAPSATQAPPFCFWLRATADVPPAWVTVYAAAPVLAEDAGQRA